VSQFSRLTCAERLLQAGARWRRVTFGSGTEYRMRTRSRPSSCFFGSRPRSRSVSSWSSKAGLRPESPRAQIIRPHERPEPRGDGDFRPLRVAGVGARLEGARPPRSRARGYFAAQRFLGGRDAIPSAGAGRGSAFGRANRRGRLPDHVPGIAHERLLVAVCLASFKCARQSPRGARRVA